MAWARRTILFVSLGVAGVARADTVWVRAAGSEPLKVPNVTVTRVAGGKVYFRLAGASGEGARAVGEVHRLTVDDEPALTAAEMAYVDGKFDQAADGYLKFLRSTSRDELKGYAGVRMVDAAGRAGRLDAAVAGYVALVEQDADLGGEHRLAAGDAKPGVIDAAVGELDKALLPPSRPARQKVALQWAKVDLLRARGDKARMALALEQLVSTAERAGTADGGAAQLLGDMRVAQATAAVDAGNGAAAEAIIGKAGAAFVTPGQQGEALFVLARAKELQAGTSANARLDAAMAYMRVVAHFPDSSRAPAAALAAAGLLAGAGDTDGARRLYGSLAGTAVADRAGKALAALR